MRGWSVAGLEDAPLVTELTPRMALAIGTSKFTGLRARQPVYRTLRELAMSYFEHYFNLEGELTLRGHGRPVNLARFDRLHWMTSEGDLWPIAEHLERIPHVPLVRAAVAAGLPGIDARLRAADLMRHPTAGPQRRISRLQAK